MQSHEIVDVELEKRLRTPETLQSTNFRAARADILRDRIYVDDSKNRPDSEMV